MISKMEFSRSGRKLPTVVVGMLLIFCAAPALAHSGIQGHVLDSTGAALPGVTVELAPSGGRVVVTAVTDGEGSYAFLAIPPGTYDISFRLINFATSVKRDVEVAFDDTAQVHATLYLSSSAEVIVTGKQTFRNLAELDDDDDLLGFADSGTVGVISASEIARQPYKRPAEVLESVPGMIISQHSGEGKANQYYLRGFNLDHGTDLALNVVGIPVNMPTHGHGQGYADTNFLIPELISGVQYKKGPYFADEGDFAAAGAVNVNYLNFLDKPFLMVQGGRFGYGRMLAAASPRAGSGFLLSAIELSQNDGPWERPDGFRKLNAVLRYSRGSQLGGFSITGMAYDAKWNSTDQIPLRAVEDGRVPRFGLIDDSDGGKTNRYSLSADWQRSQENRLTQFNAYAIDYGLNLFSNFTYFLDDPVNGDQFEQLDKRLVTGLSGSHRWIVTRNGKVMENLAGAQIRHDGIGTVGLYRTARRMRLETVREDSVDQTSGAIYFQNSTPWTSMVRTIIGLRGDAVRFRVDSDDPLNSGTADDFLLSPKAGVVFGPWRRSEFYVNAGWGFHSNDGRGSTQVLDPSTGEPVSPVDPLVRTKGAELGFRSVPSSRLHLSGGLWGLEVDSELLFVGDAGTTEASRPSRRTGIELSAHYNLRRWLILEVDTAFARARFTDDDSAGSRIPGAVEGVASAALSYVGGDRFSGSIRYRYFGPRPLIEDDSVRSDSSGLVSLRLGYSITRRYRVELDVFNLFDSEASDIDYLYASRLPGEPAGGFEDIHFHPVEPRSVRLALGATF